MSDSGDDNMARQMKTMNMMMPLMSLFFAFTLPVGLTFYWIVGAVVRTVQTVFLNRKFEKIDLDSIIEKNKAKAAKKKEKRGVRQSQIYEAAKINAKNTTASSKASYNNKASDTDSYSNSFENSDKHYKKGSLAEKANLVNDFNNKNTKR
jgi:YidC/Oxa1 family membrane protein insertase